MVCRIGAMSVLVDMDSAKIPVEAFRGAVRSPKDVLLSASLPASSCCLLLQVACSCTLPVSAQSDAITTNRAQQCHKGHGASPR